MSDSHTRDQLLKRLKQMKKELEKKEKKLKRSLRASKAKEHVKRKIKEHQNVQSPDRKSQDAESNFDSRNRNENDNTEELNRNNVVRNRVDIAEDNFTKPVFEVPATEGTTVRTVHSDTGYFENKADAINTRSTELKSCGSEISHAKFVSRKQGRVNIDDVVCFRSSPQNNPRWGDSISPAVTTACKTSPLSLISCEGTTDSQSTNCGTNTTTTSILKTNGEDNSNDSCAKRSLSLKRKKRLSKTVTPAVKFSSQSSDSQRNDIPNKTNIEIVGVEQATTIQSCITDSAKCNKFSKFEESLSLSAQKDNLSKSSSKNTEVDGSVQSENVVCGVGLTVEQTAQKLVSCLASVPESQSWSADGECSSDSQIKLPLKRSRGRPRRKSLSSLKSKNTHQSKSYTLNLSLNNIPLNTESDSQEFETLKLLQEYHSMGVDFTSRQTRHGKMYHMPSMLSSIFQYFIDESKRHKSIEEFSLPEQHFGNLIHKKYQLNTNINSQNSRDADGQENVHSKVACKNLQVSDGTEASEKHQNTNTREISSEELARTSLCDTSEDLSEESKNEGCALSESVKSDRGFALPLEEVISTPKSVYRADLSQSSSPALFPSPQGAGIHCNTSSPYTSQDSSDSNSVMHSARDGVKSCSVLQLQELKHVGHIQSTEDIVSMHAGVIQIGRSKTDAILCLHLKSICVWSEQGGEFYQTVTVPFEEGCTGIKLIGKPGVCLKLEALVVLRTSTGICIQVFSFCPHWGHHLSNSVQLQTQITTLCWLNQTDFAVGLSMDGETSITKYCLDSCQKMTKVLSFDLCKGTTKCLQVVHNMPTALASMTKENLLHLWHIDTGTLVWTLNLLNVWPCTSTVVYAAWQQNYLFLSVLADVEYEEAGVLMVINPGKDTACVLYRYRSPQWKGFLNAFPMDDYLSATDKSGSLFVWDKFSGEPCTVDLDVGIKHAAQLERKLVHARQTCVHVFSRC